MATLTVKTAVHTTPGVDGTGVAATAGGDAFANTGKEVFIVINAEAAPKTVTFARPALVDGLTVASNAVVCPASKTTYVGPFQTGVYNDANGLVQVTYSGVTTLTVAVLQVTPV